MSKKGNRFGKPLAIVGFLLVAVVCGGGLWAQTATTTTATTGAAPVAQIPLPGSAIPQFVDPLPNLFTITAPARGDIEIEAKEVQAPILSKGTLKAGVQSMTWAWHYVSPNEKTITSYIGPVIVTKRGQPTAVKFINKLGSTATSKVLAYTRSVDQTLHWADPINAGVNAGMVAVIPGLPPVAPWNVPYSGPIPMVPHLHGGEVPPVLDGGPLSWFTGKTPNTSVLHGAYFYSRDKGADYYASLRYPNAQESAPLWFHDHTLGATRLNVYAGLAGAYLITDPLNDPKNLPPLVPLVIQDRMFDTNGQLFFPAGMPYTPNPEHPLWVPEFVGDTIVVNGKTWPYLNVEPKRYTFLLLDGSNARAYDLSLIDQTTGAPGPAMYQIATDGGYLDAPVKIDPASTTGMTSLFMMPGERNEVIIDFAGLAPGTTLLMRNVAACPYPGGAIPQATTVGRIMQFKVVPLTKADTSYDPSLGAALRAKPMIRLVDPVAGAVLPTIKVAKTRQLTLNEVLENPVTVNGVNYPGGSAVLYVNNTNWDGMSMVNATPSAPATMSMRADFTPVTVGGKTMYMSELPNEGDTEVWEFVNLTGDTHPMHTHLAQFQVINRQNFDQVAYPAAYAAAFPGGAVINEYGPPLDYNTGNPRALGGNPDITPYLVGAVIPPAADELGWKDTINAPTGMVTRIAIRWAPDYLATNLDPQQLVFPFNPNVLNHGYVWHCHIIDHEDNEMMRPFVVMPKAGVTRTYVQGVDY